MVVTRSGFRMLLKGGCELRPPFKTRGFSGVSSCETGDISKFPRSECSWQQQRCRGKPWADPESLIENKVPLRLPYVPQIDVMGQTSKNTMIKLQTLRTWTQVCKDVQFDSKGYYKCVQVLAYCDSQILTLFLKKIPQMPTTHITELVSCKKSRWVTWN